MLVSGQIQEPYIGNLRVTLPNRASVQDISACAITYRYKYTLHAVGQNQGTVDHRK